MVSEGVNHYGGVLACFDNLIQVTNGADLRCGGQGTVLPPGALLVQQKPTHEIRGSHILVAGDRNEWPGESEGHVFHKAGLTAPGGTL